LSLLDAFDDVLIPPFVPDGAVSCDGNACLHHAEIRWLLHPIRSELFLYSKPPAPAILGQYGVSRCRKKSETPRGTYHWNWKLDEGDREQCSKTIPRGLPYLWSSAVLVSAT